VTIAGDLAAVRAVARQMRGAIGPPEARRLHSWARSLDSAVHGIEQGVRFLRDGILEPPSVAVEPEEPPAGTQTPEEGETPTEHRRRLRAERAQRPPKPGSAAAQILGAVAAVARDPRTAGLTDLELAQVTGLSPNTVRPRRGELVTGGWLLDSGATRTHHGAAHRVWVLSERSAGILAGTSAGP
jgi:hypothetical protein